MILMVINGNVDNDLRKRFNSVMFNFLLIPSQPSDPRIVSLFSVLLFITDPDSRPRRRATVSVPIPIRWNSSSTDRTARTSSRLRSSERAANSRRVCQRCCRLSRWRLTSRHRYRRSRHRCLNQRGFQARWRCCCCSYRESFSSRRR